MEPQYKFPQLVRDVFKDNPELKYNPVYNSLPAKKMMFVMLVADFYSPIRNKWRETDEYELRELAVKEVGYWIRGQKIPSREGLKLLKGEIPEVEKAIMEYRLEQGGEYLEKLQMVKSRIFETIDNPLPKDSNGTAQLDLDLRLIEKSVLLKLAEQEESLRKMAKEKRERNRPIVEEEVKTTDEQEEEWEYIDPDS